MLPHAAGLLGIVPVSGVSSTQRIGIDNQQTKGRVAMVDLIDLINSLIGQVPVVIAHGFTHDFWDHSWWSILPVLGYMLYTYRRTVSNEKRIEKLEEELEKLKLRPRTKVAPPPPKKPAG